MQKKLLLGLVVLILVIIGAGFWLRNQGGNNVLSLEKAKDKAETFVNEKLVSASSTNAEIKNIAEEGNLYKMAMNLKDKVITVYMSKDGKTFFPQALDMENPQLGANSSRKQQARQASKASIPKQVGSMISQGKALLDQYGDVITNEERKNMETKINELEELNNTENPKTQELKAKMQEVQKASMPLIEKVQKQQQKVGTSSQM